MNQADHTGIIPGQYTGKEIEAEAVCTLSSREEAIALYEAARQRLLDVNKWHEIAGTVSAKFCLVDAQGKELNRNAMMGDYFKIDIPGPGSKEGSGYDWVHIEDSREISEAAVQSTAIRVRPCAPPFAEAGEIAHFYSDDATSSFVVTREGNSVKSAVVDRNIKPNGQSASVTDKLRDLAVGLGAMGVFSKIQWQNLADGLIHKD